MTVGSGTLAAGPDVNSDRRRAGINEFTAPRWQRSLKSVKASAYPAQSFLLSGTRWLAARGTISVAFQEVIEVSWS